MPLGQVHRPLAEQIAEAEERKAQVEAFNAFLMEAREAELTQLDHLGHYWYNKLPNLEKDSWAFGPSRLPSMRTFLRRLPPAEILEAMDIAEGKIFIYGDGSDQKRFRYFCGVCWHMIRDREAGTSNA